MRKFLFFLAPAAMLLSFGLAACNQVADEPQAAPVARNAQGNQRAALVEYLTFWGWPTTGWSDEINVLLDPEEHGFDACYSLNTEGGMRYIFMFSDEEAYDEFEPESELTFNLNPSDGGCPYAGTHCGQGVGTTLYVKLRSE